LLADWENSGYPLPDEYIEYVLCRHIYHCPPSVLYEQDEWRCLLDIEIYAEEQRVIKAKHDSKVKSSGGGKKAFG